jgi:putative flippase GtrA
VVQVIEALVRKHGPAFAVYLVIGGVSALVEWAVFWGLLHVAPAGIFAALRLSAGAAGALRLTVYAAIAFVIATFVNYLLCVRTIYASKTGSVAGDIARVYLASLLAFGVNLATLVVLTAGLGLDPMVGKIAGTGTAFLVNFAARQFVIFAPRLQPSLFGSDRARRDAAE